MVGGPGPSARNSSDIVFFSPQLILQIYSGLSMVNFKVNYTFLGPTFSRGPYGKAVFVRISDENAVNILRTALFTVIVRYIFTSCRKYPANNVGLTKKWSLNVCSLSYNRCIFAAKT